ncbi:MAG: glutamate-5-semialdehyde dehydrogenase [Kiritimatiellia bacterium]
MAEIGRQAHCAMHELNRLSKKRSDLILQDMAQALIDRQSGILSANADDLADAREGGLSAAMLDRLRLDEKRITAMADGLRAVAALPNPLGRVIRRWTRPNQLKISKVRVPIGVIAIIYEARPNVTADAAALCFKTGNAVILRSGHEALRSAGAIVDALIAGGKPGGLPDNAIQLVRSGDRAAVRELVQLEGLVNLVIPRGGEALIRAVNEMARVPVIKHYKGVCHIYVDESADIDMAIAITENAKCQRPGVCNAAETLLVHEKIAARFLPALARRLTQHNVELRGDTMARGIVPTMLPADESDWYAEYLDLILAIRVVPSVQAAIEHINQYGSGHSDAIITQSAPAARLFKRDVDAAAVYVNASTRFTDGGEFGMGAEIGISTDKLHARGPMGLEELTTYKYLIDGQGQTRS